MTEAVSQDRVAIITGASGGIGSAVARKFALNGVKVVIADIRGAQESAEMLASEFGVDAFGFLTDVTDSASVAALVHNTLERYGRLDHVVNCAGMSLNGPSTEHPDEQWKRVLDLNLTGTFYVCRESSRALAASGGTIVNISSIAAFAATNPEVHVGYDATKAAIIALTRTLAVEWAKDGVRVNAVAPGYTNTELLKEVGASDPETIDAWIGQTPYRRLMEPDEIANVIYFLSSTASSAITGQTIIADGGYLSAK